jgi:hypothetical protein
MQNGLNKVFCAVTPCISERARRFGEILRLKSKPEKKPTEAGGKLASTLKMEAIFSFETSSCLQAIRLYNPEDRTDLSRGREIPKYNNLDKRLSTNLIQMLHGSTRSNYVYFSCSEHDMFW